MIPLSLNRRSIKSLGRGRWVWYESITQLMLVALISASVCGQSRPTTHRLYHGDMEPGAIGRQQSVSQGSWRGYFQPVEIRVPNDALIAPASSDQFASADSSRLKVGMEVGKPYRFHVSRFQDTVPIDLYPSIELVDRTYPPCAVRLDFPIPVDLSEDDLRQAANGRYIIRVVYLEDPNFASPFAQKATDAVPFFDVDPTQDPLSEADHVGRPVAIVKLGNRAPTSENGPDIGFLFGCPLLQPYPIDLPGFNRANLDWRGAVDTSGGVAKASVHAEEASLLPETTLSRLSKMAPLSCPTDPCPTCSQLVRPRDEYICDGGDDNHPARVNRQGAVDGVEPVDAIVHYKGVDGERRILPSNRVCIYAPRFAAVRKVINYQSYEVNQWAGGMIRDDLPYRFREMQPSAAVKQPESTVRAVHATVAQAVQDRQPGLLVDEIVSLRESENGILPFEGLLMVELGLWNAKQFALVEDAADAATTWSLNQSPQIAIDADRILQQVNHERPQVTYEYHLEGNPCVRLVKLATEPWAQPGETVDFMLRFDNVGADPVNDLTVIDSLTTRLEYVPDSQQCDRKATFTHEDNPAESLRLVWRIEEEIAPGEGGIVRFRCRVR